MDNIQEIYKIFQEYYGDAFVDLQSFNSGLVPTNSYDERSCSSAAKAILIHWPSVVVTNERNQSITIWGLYCKVLLDNNGLMVGYPMFTRSEYDDIQWNSNYCHSHVPYLNRECAEYFRRSCLGSGPIRNTISSICLSVDLEMWRLFCWELDKYVHVESLAGVPYMRLASVTGQDGFSNVVNDITLTVDPGTSYFLNTASYARLVRDFTRHLLKSKTLKFSFCDGTYRLGSTMLETTMNVSNLFIEWYNSHSEERKLVSPEDIKRAIMKEAFIVDRGLLYKEDTNVGQSLSRHVGKVLFTFKGKQVKLTRHNDVTLDQTHTVLVMKNDILGYIIYKILRYLNIYYGSTEIRDIPSDTSYKAVRII